MGRDSDKPVVAAVDGTAQSIRALEWAADEARFRDRRLRIVHVAEWPLRHLVFTDPTGGGPDDFARRVVQDAQQRASARVPEVSVEAVHVAGEAVPALLAESERADVLVLGSRGLSTLGSALLGSTGIELSAKAACPVVVVPYRRSEPRSRRITVGVDGSAPSLAALDWAFALAEEHDAVLSVVTVYDDRPGMYVSSVTGAAHLRPSEVERAAAKELAQQMLAKATESGRARHPGVEVREVVGLGHAAHVLISQAEETDLLVVGARGLGGFIGMLLGSVSQSVLTHCPRPVGVVRAP